MTKKSKAKPQADSSKRSDGAERKRRAELAALAVAAVLGVPLAVGLASALSSGVSLDATSEERSMVGEGRFAELTDGDGESGFPHYLGHDRLAPDFELEQWQSDQRWSLADHRGDVVVVNFWSSDCPPCIEEMPSLERLAHLVRKWGDVQVLAIATDPSWEETEIERHEPQWTALSGLSLRRGRPESALKYLLDPDKHVSNELFGSELYPETWIIDRNGVVRFRYDGAFDWSSPLALDLIDSYR